MSAPGSAVRVAVDAMGGDYGPGVVVEGAVAACRESRLGVRVVGPQRVILDELARLGAEDVDLSVVDAPEVVGMGDRVTRSTLKRRSSIHVAMELVRRGEAQAFFSAGNTAACWTIAKYVLGTMDEVDRPALAAVVPKPTGRTMLIDVGANASCKARQLEQFAVMGTAYVRLVLGNPEPRVGLMSMGEEESKGNELTKEVHEALKGSHLNFIGNVEGHDVFGERVDVVVMDGFTGNVMLKASEAMASSMMRLMREELGRSIFRRLGAWLSRPAFRALHKRIDAAEYGGAPLLGVRGCCFIGHGRSTATAVKHGIKAAAEFFTRGVNAELASELSALSARRRSVMAG
jgi:glycerol-3-phosphate acyltransferase PlsX